MVDTVFEHRLSALQGVRWACSRERAGSKGDYAGDREALSAREFYLV